MTPETIIRLRGAYRRLAALAGRNAAQEPAPPPCIRDKERIQHIIAERISSGQPMMMARFGTIECDVCENMRNTFYGGRGGNWRFIRWRGQPSFVNPYVVPLFTKNAGFFPEGDIRALRQFYELMVDCMPEVDVLQSWRYNELVFERELKRAIKVDREMSTPLLTDKPWTLALEGKRVLVIHPFAETIESQYSRIDKVFPQGTIMPPFQLQTIKAVQTAGGGSDKRFSDWFEALQWMKDETDRRHYDVALIGCGAYGFPLAAHCKHTGHQALHIGGGLQLLFGIKGRRWESSNIYKTTYPYAATYYNDYWVRPAESDKPANARGVEGACYW